MVIYRGCHFYRVVQSKMNNNPKDKLNRIKINTETLESAPWFEGVADDIRAAQKSGDTDDPVDFYVYAPFAIRLAHVFIRKGLSANAATLMSLFIGITGGILLYPQNRWINLIGILFELFATVLDCCDGQIARLTHTSSQLGRVLDGSTDILVFLTMYISIGCRMMNEPMPFTGGNWSFWIWIPFFLMMVCHAGQARMGDYYRGMHLYFLKGSSSANLSRSKDIREEIATLPGDSPLYLRVYLSVYLIYTRLQENRVPRSQHLLDLTEKYGIPAEVSDAYITQSRRYIQLTNVLTYNVRAYTLFILLLLQIHVFYIPFVLLILEAVKFFMVAKYEAIAESLTEKFSSAVQKETV